ncbi:MAG: signal peptidase I [Bifidobacteriaceae bacterium]|nr:signal peptidase I [Bifidobacteriaceae bacterium]
MPFPEDLPDAARPQPEKPLTPPVGSSKPDDSSVGAAPAGGESAGVVGNGDSSLPGDLPGEVDSGSDKSAGAGRSRRGRRPKKPAKPQSKLVRFIKDAVFVVVAALILSFLLKTFLIQSFYIPSESMENTLHKWDRVIVTKLAPKMLKVHRGDIVVFRDPGGWVSNPQPLPERGWGVDLINKLGQAVGLAPIKSEDFLIKRVIGTGGDRVACAGGGAPITVNGVPLTETYLPKGVAPSLMEFSVVVPEGAVWVMGDNRSSSADSRAHMEGPLGGAVSLDQLVGIAQFRTYPFDRFGPLRNPSEVFASVLPPTQGGGQ